MAVRSRPGGRQLPAPAGSTSDDVDRTEPTSLQSSAVVAIPPPTTTKTSTRPHHTAIAADMAEGRVPGVALAPPGQGLAGGALDSLRRRAAR